ncbi:MAG: nitrile hydratase subunit beta [Burkholderiaceae bacterium]
MNGPHDLGGQQGFGPVRPDPDPSCFHAPWESRAFALTLAMGATGTWTLDATRHARESLPPAEYLRSSYYRIWWRGLWSQLLSNGLVSEQELLTGQVIDAAKAVRRVLDAGDVARAMAAGASTGRPLARPAAYAVGERVRARRMNPTHHTRLPRYVRGCEGTIAIVHGAHVFPDANAHGQGEAPQWLYCVRFDARDLWGPDTTADAVHVDCWQSYLERAA